MVHTKTYTLMHPWAETTPWECLVRQTGCISGTHNHNPMVNQRCSAPQCDEPLKAGETCYAVTELERDAEGREPWVCWRHVRPDDGPIRTTREKVAPHG